MLDTIAHEEAPHNMAAALDTPLADLILTFPVNLVPNVHPLYSQQHAIPPQNLENMHQEELAMRVGFHMPALEEFKIIATTTTILLQPLNRSVESAQ